MIHIHIHLHPHMQPTYYLITYNNKFDWKGINIMKKSKSLLLILGSFLISYCILFILLPLLPGYYTKDNIFLIIIIGMITADMFFISRFLPYYLLGDVLFFLLVWIYPANGAYGMGITGVLFGDTYFSRDELAFDIAIVGVEFLVFELLIWIVVTIIKKIVEASKKRRKIS